MTAKPLVGKNSSPHVSSFFISVISSLIFWTAFTLFSFFAKFLPEKKEYETVQIVLDSTPLVEKPSSDKNDGQLADESEAFAEEIQAEEAPAMEAPAAEIPEPELPIVEAPVVESPKPAPVTPAPEPVKPAPAKTESVRTEPAKTVPQSTPDDKKVDFSQFEYAADYSEGIDFSGNSSAKTSSFDWDSFDNASVSSTQTQNQPRKVSTSNEISGSAASAAETQKQSQSGGGKKTEDPVGAASTATKNLLGAVRESNYTATASDGSKSISTVSTAKTTDGKLAVAMSDGSNRILLEPSSPSIKLSEEAASYIDSDKNVRISFSVSKSGNVTDIKISPESVLHAKVREEIRNQLTLWLFENAEASAIASFEYTIIKK